MSAKPDIAALFCLKSQRTIFLAAVLYMWTLVLLTLLSFINVFLFHALGFDHFTTIMIERVINAIITLILAMKIAAPRDIKSYILVAYIVFAALLALGGHEVLGCIVLAGLSMLPVRQKTAES